MSPTEERMERASRVRERLGLGPVSPGRPGSVLGDFLDLINEFIFGEVWSRPGLAIEKRSLVTMATLTALGRWPELRLHVRGALSLGLPRQEIIETVMHAGLYAGVPAAVEGLRTVNDVFHEADGDGGPGGA